MESKQLYQIQPDASPEKSNLLSDINRMYEVVSCAAKFKTHYDDVINVISGIDSRMSQYNSIGKNAVKCDIIETVIKSLNFDKMGEELKTKIKSKSKPMSGLQFVPIISSLNEFSLDAYQQDEIKDMFANLPEDGSKKKKASKFLDAQRRAINYMKQYVNDFEFFEKGLIKRRTAIISSVESNIPYLINEHYKVVYKTMTEDGYSIPSSITVGDKEIPFVNKQRDFIKGAINELCKDIQ